MRRIAWVDDSRGEFDRVCEEWKSNESAETVLKYWSLDEVMHDNGDVLQQLLDNPPEILLLDWNDGSISKIYHQLKNEVKITILISWNRQDHLRLAGVFNNWPELEDRTLTKPFTAAQLAVRISGATDTRGPLEKVGQWLHHHRGATDERGVDDLLPIRYLNEAMVPVAISQGWKLDINRPVIEWPDNKRAELIKNGQVQHSVFSSFPADPEKFGAVLFVTKPLPLDVKGAWPTNARYFQLAQVLPETSAGLKELGSSVNGIIEFMRQAGFARGRYYHLTDVPGLSEPSLELVARFPDEPSLLPLPAAKSLDANEKALFMDYENQYRDNFHNKNALIFKLRDVGPQNSGANDDFWGGYVNILDIKNRLEVPIFYSGVERRLGSVHGDGMLRKIRGVFVFDRANSDILKEKHVKAVESALLSAIKYLNGSRVEEHERFEQKRATQLLQFHEQLGELESDLAVEHALIKKAVEIVGLDAHGGVTEHKAATRSATFVRFDGVQKQLEVSCETDDVMKGYIFTMDLDEFVLVRCSLRALEALFKKTPPLPLYEPNFNIGGNLNSNRRDAFRKVRNCTPERLEACMARLEKVRTVVAFPVASGGQLLGVLVLRSDRPYEFTRRRVGSITKVINVALPYLERMRSDRNRKTWDGLVMHEMRANLSWAKSKINRVENAGGDVERRQSIHDVKLVLEEGISLSNMFLRWLGARDEVPADVTNDSFWESLNEYGDFRARSSESLKWHWSFDRRCNGVNAAFLGRAIRVLVANAYRHALPEGKRILCDISLDEANNHLIVKIENPGWFVENKINPELSNHKNSSEYFPRTFKEKIGLSLVRMLCNEVGVVGPELRFENNERGNEPTVTVILRWPCAGVV